MQALFNCVLKNCWKSVKCILFCPRHSQLNFVFALSLVTVLFSQWLFADRIDYFKVQIKECENLLLYLISIRVFPLTPNFFINFASPLIGVPLNYFFISVFVGKYAYMNGVGCNSSFSAPKLALACAGFLCGFHPTKARENVCWRFNSYCVPWTCCVA
jgi:hypothetical protein